MLQITFGDQHIHVTYTISKTNCPFTNLIRRLVPMLSLLTRSGS